MMIRDRIKNIFKRTLLMYHSKESLHRLVVSLCMGVYIAFSPFVGFHTMMVFLFAWLFALNAGLMLLVSVCINNPYTMIPIYMIDYGVGSLVCRFLGIDQIGWNPQWVTKLNVVLGSYIDGMQVSLWAFLIGGNLLGIGIGIIVYPVLRYIFASYFAGMSK